MRLNNHSTPLRHLLLCLFLPTVIGCQSFSPSPQALGTTRVSVTEEGLIDCFSRGTQPVGKPVFCEASAVTKIGDTLLILSDKPLPSRSPAFSIPLNSTQPEPTHALPIESQPIQSALKFEAITQAPDQQLVIASTAFDRFDPRNARWDAYNTILAWPANAPQNAHVLNASTRDGISSSVSLRQSLETYLGVPYFKVEGLTLLADQRLLFGIRETGKDHQDFSYRILIVSAKLERELGKLVISPPFTLLLDYTPPADLGLEKNLGISSIETSGDGHTLYFLTSHEDNNTFGAYLWEWDTSAKNPAPTLLKDASGQPLHFTHKAEGMTMLDKQHLFIIHDDDRKTGGTPLRQPHQAVYSIIKLENRN